MTGRAKARIRRFIRSRQREEYASLGRAILQKTFRENDYELTDKGLEGILKVFKANTVEDLCADVGAGNHTGREIMEAVFPGMREKRLAADKAVQAKRPPAGTRQGYRCRGAHCRADSGHGGPLRRLLPSVARRPDRRQSSPPGRGVTIHTIDCPVLESYIDEPERWLDVSWQTNRHDQEHLYRPNQPDPAETNRAASAVSPIWWRRTTANISNLRIINRSPDFFEMLMDIEVADVKHLTNIIAALRASPVINTVDRARG